MGRAGGVVIACGKFELRYVSSERGRKLATRKAEPDCPCLLCADVGRLNIFSLMNAATFPLAADPEVHDLQYLPSGRLHSNWICGQESAGNYARKPLWTE